MLLSVLILIGAILVPDEYVWLYSTHIALVCLYLIFAQRFWLLFLAFLSLIALCLSEGGPSAVIPSLEKQQVLCFNPVSHTIYMNEVSSLNAIKDHLFSVRLESPDGVKHNYNDVLIEPLLVAPNEAKQVVFKRYVLAKKHGNWLEQRLYVERQAAQLEVQSSMAIEEEKSFSIKGYIYARLNATLSSYASWRYSKALLLGDNSDWSERDKWIVRALGLAHLFVVSGLHTGFVFAFGCLLSRLVWRLSASRWVLSGLNCWMVDATVIIPILLFYAYLTGWGAPVVRAGIMLSLYLMSKVLFTQISSYNVVIFALWSILLEDPRAVLQPGLWLSFSLVCFLIAFSQASRGWSRVILMQLMLSTASMVLIWGWQDSISVLSIPINIIMIPLTAFIWFPAGILACFEVLLSHSSNLYLWMDKGLFFVLNGLEKLAFTLPMLPFDAFLSVVPKILLLLLVIFWVWQTPLRRGWLCLLLIWCVLLVPINSVSGVQYQIANIGNELVYKDGVEIELSDHWSGRDLSQRLIHPFNTKSSFPHILLAPSTEKLSPLKLLNNNIDWILFKKMPSDSLQSMLTGLKIDWLPILSGEMLLFRQRNGFISVHHLACPFSIFLFKSDTCKRVEKLEFMLN